MGSSTYTAFAILYLVIAAFRVFLRLIELIGSLFQYKFQSIAKNKNEKRLRDAIQALATEHRLHFSDQILFPATKVAVCVDPFSQKVVLANKEMKPTVFDCTEITKYAVRNRINEHLSLWNQYYLSDPENPEARAEAEAAYQNARGRYLATVSLFVGNQEILLPILYHDDSTTKTACKKAAAVLGQIDQVLGGFVPCREVI